MAKGRNLERINRCVNRVVDKCKGKVKVPVQTIRAPCPILCIHAIMMYLSCMWLLCMNTMYHSILLLCSLT